MITGTTMLPIMIEAPMTTVPAKTVAVGPAERMIVPASTPSRQTMTAISGPARRMRRLANGVARAKHSTGSPVMSPAVAPDRPRSSWMRPSTGAGATIGPRRLSAMRMMPTTTAHGRAVRAEEERLDISF